jgi:hypothetical protein
MASCWIFVGICFALVLAAAIGFFFDTRGERKALRALMNERDQHLLDAMNGLKQALVEAGAIERKALPPPAPTGLPVREVSMTRDSAPVHTRETREVIPPPPMPGRTARPPAAPTEPPPTQPTSRPRRVHVSDLVARALDRAEEQDMSPQERQHVALWRSQMERLRDEMEGPARRSSDLPPPIDPGPGVRGVVGAGFRPPSVPPPARLTPTTPSATTGTVRPVVVPLGGHDEAVDTCYAQLLARAIEQGEDVRHCAGLDCHGLGGDAGTEVCSCTCPPCSRATELLFEAHRQVHGDDPTPA